MKRSQLKKQEKRLTRYYNRFSASSAHSTAFILRSSAYIRRAWVDTPSRGRYIVRAYDVRGRRLRFVNDYQVRYYVFSKNTDRPTTNATYPPIPDYGNLPTLKDWPSWEFPELKASLRKVSEAVAAVCKTFTDMFAGTSIRKDVYLPGGRVKRTWTFGEIHGGSEPEPPMLEVIDEAE